MHNFVISLYASAATLTRGVLSLDEFLRRAFAFLPTFSRSVRGTARHQSVGAETGFRAVFGFAFLTLQTDNIEDPRSSFKNVQVLIEIGRLFSEEADLGALVALSVLAVESAARNGRHPFS